MKRWFLGTVVLVVLTSAGESQGGFLYTGHRASGYSELVRIDTTDGSWTTIENSSPIHYSGLAYNGNAGYGVAFDLLNPGEMHKVDFITGETSFIAQVPAGSYGAVFSRDFSVVYTLGWWLDPKLQRVNPATGEYAGFANATHVGVGDLTINSHNVLYASTTAGDIWTIDQATGQASLVASLIHPSGLAAISFDENDDLFGITGNFGTTGNQRLVKIDLASKTTTMIGSTQLPYDTRGLDFMRPENHDAPPPPGGVPGGGGGVIPEPSTLVLWSGLGAMGLIAAWRRRKAV